ncbi:twin-arginine translocase subunit TatC [Nonomuraea longicatena]|uniref:Sec-independent protein translocase protein TatC n=1 Tax=Nonomuraea longicatena TaxID=83682 RepID=A0ABN1NY99_9ACTN
MALLKKPRSGGSEPPDPEGRMPLMDHLRELRNRVVVSVIAVAVTTIVGLIFFDPIWAFMSEPYCSLPIAQKVREGTCTFAVRGVFESFFVNIKVAALVGVVAASPIWLHQLWSFVTPALYRNEKKYTVVFLVIAVPLFFLGAFFAYLVMDTSLGFMLSFMPDSALPFLEMSDYLTYWVIMLAVFGVSFELPLLLIFLNVIGVLPRATLVKHRRMIIFLLFVFSAIITPGGDIITMAMLAGPMVLLFAVAELIMFVRERRNPAVDSYEGLDDDEASPLDLSSEPETASDLDSPADLDSKNERR